jgi:hypothetical protein
VTVRVSLVAWRGHLTQRRRGRIGEEGIVEWALLVAWRGHLTQRRRGRIGEEGIVEWVLLVA